MSLNRRVCSKTMQEKMTLTDDMKFEGLFETYTRGVTDGTEMDDVDVIAVVVELGA